VRRGPLSCRGVPVRPPPRGWRGRRGPASGPPRKSSKSMFCRFMRKREAQGNRICMPGQLRLLQE
jgi:hypothetical protein